MSVFRMAMLVSALTLAGCAEIPKGLHYVAVGASDALGVGAVPPTEGYVYRIRDALDRNKSGPVSLRLLAVPSAEANLLDGLVEAYLKNGDEPGLVTLWVGSNDLIAGRSAAAFEHDLTYMLGMMRERGIERVFIANIPNLSELPRFRTGSAGNVTGERVQAYNEAIERQAHRFGYAVVDLAERDIAAKTITTADGLHPNNEGHRLIV
ncbi:MAG: SGNH/GDSL hydrolase family protein, partial [Rhodospirillales bacterium]|nr:SGNH/GDSL hydrolase family protein [Rhodospirillales bacterium]